MSIFDRDYHHQRDQSWALKAVEREAMSRALAQLHDRKVVTVMGLTPTEIALLKNFYEKVTGRDPYKIRKELHELEQYCPSKPAG